MSLRRWVVIGCVCLGGGALIASLSQKQQVSPIEVEQQQNASVDEKSAADEAVTTPASAASEQSAGSQSLTEVNRMLPEFELSGIDESIWTTQALKGKPWVINFWATWCAPCIEEIPSMNAAFEILAPEGVGMLAINAGEGVEAVSEFLKKIPIEFPNAMGNMNTLQNWSVKALPTTIVVNAQGEIVYEALGPREWDDEALLQRVMALL